MAYSSNIVKTKRDGMVTLKDGSAGPVSYIANFNVGDFSWEDSKPDLIVIRDRASIVGARLADNPEIAFSFSVHLRALTDSSNDTLLDFVNGTLSGASLTSVAVGGYEPFLCDVEFKMDATATLSDTKSYIATFSKCRLILSLSEGDPSSISVSGTCLGGVAYT